MNGNVELLAPAGSYENFKAAVSAGADAVYLGGSLFSARAYANNFSREELLCALDYAHLHNRSVYMTVNTLMKEQELKEDLVEFLAPYYENGLDGVILQDLGAARTIRQNFPDLPCHASTQMSVTGVEGAKYLKKLGFTRVVPARELCLEEIQAIYKETGLEVESFIHGALCYCYSGQCLLSGMIGGRSGNRGRCAQPCRLEYRTQPATAGQNHTSQNERGRYLLSPKDMATITILPELIESGVYSLKIEGRMKSCEYTAGVVSIYRKYLDRYLEKGKEAYKVAPKDMTALMDLYNRGGFSRGYYKQGNGAEMMSTKRPNHAGVEAIRAEQVQKGKMTFRALTDLYQGDVFEIAGDFNLTLGRDIPKGEKFTMQVPAKYISKGGRSYARIKCARLVKNIEEKYISDRELVKEAVSCRCVIRVGEKLSLKLWLDREPACSVTVTGDAVMPAQNQPVNKAGIVRQLGKMGETPFVFENEEAITVECDGNAFVPIQAVNELRRSGAERLCQAVIDGRRRQSAGKEKTVKENGCVSSDENRLDEKNLDEKNLNEKKLDEKESEPLSVRILVSTPEQLEGLADWIGDGGKNGMKAFLGGFQENLCREAALDRIYVDYNCFYDDTIKEQLSGIIEKSHGRIQIYGALPRVLRQNRREVFDKLLLRIAYCKADGLLVRNLEELAMAQNGMFSGYRLVADHSLYAWNNAARSVITDTADEFTAPLELDCRELAPLDADKMEMMVYGYIPVMVSAQCVKKTLEKCDGNMSEIVIYDRKNAPYRVSSQCRFCHSVMYYSRPLYILEHGREIHTRRWRYDFTVETKQQMLDVLKAGPGDYTTGHFQRGVL